MQLKDKIAELRKQKKMTQEQLAEACSVSAQAVSKWENGITSPDISLLPRLAEIFGVTVDELLGVKKTETVTVDPAAVDLTKVLLRVHAISADGDEVNINIPFVAAEALSQTGNFISFDGDRASALRGIDFAQIAALIRSGTAGKLIEVKSAEGDRVEIWAE